jgi:hypothetical protein
MLNKIVNCIFVSKENEAVARPRISEHSRKQALVFLQAVERDSLRSRVLKLSSLTGRHVSKHNNL